MKQKYYLAAFVALTMTAISTIYAGVSSSENDALAVTSARISLAQAATSAEKQEGGKAARAEYESYKGRNIFDVEVVKGADVMTVKVDATNGTILSVETDELDRDDGKDKAD
jgi:uncharacterized membrane protein YkoI